MSSDLLKSTKYKYWILQFYLKFLWAYLYQTSAYFIGWLFEFRL